MCTKTLINSIITTFLCLLFQASSYAEIYKWTDENGQVHYGEHPGNTGAEKVSIRQNETTKPRPINKAEVDTAESDKNNSSQQAEATGELVEVPPSKKEKRKLCNQAKSDIAAINNRGRMREINKKGEYVYLTEQQRQQRLSAARKKQGEFCR